MTIHWLVIYKNLKKFYMPDVNGQPIAYELRNREWRDFALLIFATHFIDPIEIMDTH